MKLFKGYYLFLVVFVLTAVFVSLGLASWDINFSDSKSFSAESYDSVQMTGITITNTEMFKVGVSFFIKNDQHQETGDVKYQIAIDASELPNDIVDGNSLPLKLTLSLDNLAIFTNDYFDSVTLKKGSTTLTPTVTSTSTLLTLEFNVSRVDDATYDLTVTFKNKLVYDNYNSSTKSNNLTGKTFDLSIGVGN